MKMMVIHFVKHYYTCSKIEKSIGEEHFIFGKVKETLGGDYIEYESDDDTTF